MTGVPLMLRTAKPMSVAAWFAIVLLGWILTTASTGPSRADLPPLHAGHVIVEQAYATPGEIGGSSRLRFKIRNDAAQSFHLLSVNTAVAQSARMVIRAGVVSTIDMDSIIVPSGEILDFTTSHIWISLDNLREDLRVGDEFDVNLVLHFPSGTWSLAVQVHVHELDED